MASRTGTAFVRNATLRDAHREAQPSVVNPATLAIPELQLLRAAGCCLVFLAHTLVVIFPARFMGSIDVPAGELFARAVIGFFILSGLVLTLPYVGEQSRPFKVRQFYFDRLSRLYPAYLVSVVFALGVRFAISKWVGLSGINPWAQRFWSLPLTGRSLLEHLFAISIQTRNINPVYWTLSLEIQACLLFPLMIFLVRRTRHGSLAVLPIVALTILSHFFPQIPVIRTVSYFLMGAYVARFNLSLKRAFLAIPTVAWTAILAGVSVFFYVAPRAAVTYRLSFIVLDCLLALSMVVVQIWSPLVTISKLKPVQRFAELSYCFYLLHLPILAASAFALRPLVQSATLTILAALSLSIVVALFVHEVVEAPIRRWAKTRLQVVPDAGDVLVGRTTADAPTTATQASL